MKIERSKPDIKKILIIKNCCIGDVLMTTPLVATIRSSFPDAHIDYMVGDWSKAAIEDNPGIDNVITYIAPKPRNLFKLLALRKNNYDIIIVCDVGLKPAVQAYLIGARYKTGFDIHNKGFLFSHRVKRVPGDVHETKGYLKLAEFFNVKPQKLNLRFYIDDRYNDWADNFLMENGLADREIIGIFPGGGHNPGADMPNKRWSVKKYSEVCRYLSNRNLRTLIFGSKKDEKIVSEVKFECDNPVTAITPTIKHLAALISKCRLFISNDCGPMHLSAAVGVPTLSVWGPTDPNLLAPLGEEHHYIKSKLNCSPCFKQVIGNFEQDFNKCDKVECMEDITVEEVLKQVDVMLADRVPAR